MENNIGINAFLSKRNVLEDGFVWEAKQCSKPAKSKQERSISSKMAAVQEGIHCRVEYKLGPKWGSHSLKSPRH